MVFHRWAGILRFIVRALQKRSEGSGLGYQPEEHYRKLAVCKIQRKDKPSVLCFKRQLLLGALPGSNHFAECLFGHGLDLPSTYIAFLPSKRQLDAHL